jgi:acetylornithine/succinyldiaminopimelate/putrescine aminotransferase
MQSVRIANLFHTAGLLVIPAGAQILRLLPPLNLRRDEAGEGLKLIESVVANLST